MKNTHRHAWTRSLLLGIPLFFSAVLSAGALDIPDEMLIDNWGYEKENKGPVPFRHKAHSAEFNRVCDECHHNYKPGDSVQKCRACHNPVATDVGPMRLSSAYHKNCKVCHETLYYSGKPAGPFKKCNDCHLSMNDVPYTDYFYVGKNGCGGNTPCYSSIQAAMNASQHVRLHIMIDGNVYDEPIVLNTSKAVYLEGNGQTILRQAPRATQGMLRIRDLRIKP